MLDYLIKNARIIDGTGAVSYTGSVGIREGKLVMVNGAAEAAQVAGAAFRKEVIYETD